MDEYQRPNDWTGRILHFLFGAIIGAIIGFGGWARFASDNAQGWILIGAGALVLGLLGALWGDRFWYGFGRIFKYWLMP
jgi:hypothetical protein